jgi:hypothetical protein
MEKVLYTTTLDDIKKAAGLYDRVYFGAEFCQWRLPTPGLAQKAYDAARGAGLGFSLMTPWVTDAGLKRVKKILDGIITPPSSSYPKRGTEGVLLQNFEVIVNDLGVLMLLKDAFPAVMPVLGRLLVKQKRCPRVPCIIEGLPEAGREVYLHAGAEDRVAAKLLRRFGVKRVELDNPLQGLTADLKGVGLKGSIYTPFAYVTTTRHCPASFDGEGWQAFTGCRIKGCLGNLLSLTNPAHEARLLMRGNTQFVENHNLPPNMKEMGIDRVVHMEDVP